MVLFTTLDDADTETDEHFYITAYVDNPIMLGSQTVSTTGTVTIRDKRRYEFSIPENSPIGTMVGTVYSTDLRNFTLSNPHFSIDWTTGNITVENASRQDFENQSDRIRTFDVLAFNMSKGSTEAISVTVKLTNVNEKPRFEYQGSSTAIILSGTELGITELSFFSGNTGDGWRDPENDELTIRLVQQGVLGVVHEINGEFVWIPKSSTKVGQVDEFTVQASDGELSSDLVVVRIVVSGQKQFSSIKKGNTPPPLTVDTDLPASGFLADIAYPDRAYKRDLNNALGFQIAASRTFRDTALSTGLGLPTSQAVERLNHYLENTGAPVTQDVLDLLRKSNFSKGFWQSDFSTLSSQFNQLDIGFIGTQSFVTSAAHLGRTGDSDWSLAIGNYTGWSSFEVTGSIVSGKLAFTLSWTYHFWDPYDWDPSQGYDTFKPQLATLHLYGMAKQYMVEGTYVKLGINWNKGDAVAPPTLD